jgi:hypothetical protein
MSVNNAIIPGSLGAIAKREGISLAESFLSCDALCIVDTSGSMNNHDSRGGRSRYEVACEELANLQNTLPGKIAVISFSDETQFCPSGIPVFQGGGTDLAGALRFCKVADVAGMQFIVISDGQPDSPDEALKVARSYQNKISTIYVGPEAYPTGRDFLEQLAKASGGQSITADRAKELAAATERLLLSA